MKTVTLYECEFCGTRYDTEIGAKTCESNGLPSPVPWLPLLERVPAFGENGIDWAVITEVRVLPYSMDMPDYKHRWGLWTEHAIYLSHNQETSRMWFHPEAFDPRIGWDAFRYSCYAEDAVIWRKAMARYGFEESEANASVLSAVRRAEAA